MVIKARSSSRTQQKGVTLITVMVILIVVTLLGVSAMRMSLAGLTMSTNSQVANLLFQSGTAGFTQLVDEINRTTGKATLAGGILADAVVNEDKEFSYCVTPKTAAAGLLTKGTCDANNDNMYMSGRNAVLTQVSFKVVKSNEMAIGTDVDLARQVVPLKIMIYSTAVLPSFGSASKTTINDCFTKVNDDKNDTPTSDTISVADCMTDNGAVSNSQIDEANYGYDFGG